ncbi:hypothetical protein V3390_09420 [Luteimonas sp. FXH3W]|uniref:Uncharacterized protein n=1 Tax=Aquilutibacter rugosus TaxID=3115820 RepID=A0ABU7V3I5_9GAMM
MYSADEIVAARAQFDLPEDRLSDEEVSAFIQSTTAGGFLILRLRLSRFFKAVSSSFRRTDA